VRKRTHGEISRKLVWINIDRNGRKVYANGPVFS
jgi:hypothetical protein